LKVIALILVILCGGLLIYGTSDFPPWSDPESPASTHVSPYYIEHTIEDTSVPNIVTSVLADYRGFDTMFETIVIFTAGIACFFLLRVTKREDHESRLYHIQLFALYVIAHGHHSPGGGFQGGVIIGAAMILFAISNDLRAAILRLSEKIATLFCSTGVFIYAGTGLLCLLLGLNFLDYGALAKILFTDPVTARSHGILAVEVGVGIAVMGVVVSIYYNLSSAGKHDEGL
jgi:multicomponent Na+:H+ antiporter subunit B